MSILLEWVGKGKYKLVHEQTVIIGNVITITIPAGYKTDLASIPKTLRWLIDKDDDRIMVPAITHDILYSARVNRFLADAVLWDLMGQYGAGRLLRFLVYKAVRMFGWIGYNKHQD